MLVSQASFREETSGGDTKCRLFSKARYMVKCRFLYTEATIVGSGSQSTSLVAGEQALGGSLGSGEKKRPPYPGAPQIACLQATSLVEL